LEVIIDCCVDCTILVALCERGNSTHIKKMGHVAGLGTSLGAFSTPIVCSPFKIAGGASHPKGWESERLTEFVITEAQSNMEKYATAIPCSIVAELPEL